MARKYVPVSAPQKTVDYDALPLDKPVAVYYRQSTLEQVGNVSTAIQLFDMPEQLKAYGWKKEQIILIDADAGVSGTLKIEERDGMRRLFDMVVNREIAAVATIDEDRLFRDITMIQADTFIEACRESGVMVITPSVRYIFHHPMMGGVYIAQFRRKCEMAAEYIESFIKRRLGGARQSIRLNGRWAGQRIFGYMADMRDKNSATYRNLVPHTPFAEAILTIFQTYVECGGSAYKTRLALKERGFRMPSIADNPLPDGFRGNYGMKRYVAVPSERMIRDLVTNVMYRGDYVYRGAVIRRHNHPAIVPDELFTAAFNLASLTDTDGAPNIDYHGRVQRRSPSEHLRKIDRPLLEGRLYVSVDGEWRRAGVMWRENWGRYGYTAKRPEATSPTWCRDSGSLDDAIRYFLQGRLKTTAASEAIGKHIEDQERARESELKRLNAQIRAAEQRIENLATKIEQLSDNRLLSDFEGRYTLARAEYDRMLARRDALKSDPAKRVKREVRRQIMEWAQEETLPDDGARQLIAALIERVEVTDYEKHGVVNVTIHWTDTEPTQFELSRSAAKAWGFTEIEALKYHAASMSQVVRSAAVPLRTCASIRAQARRLGLPKVASGIVREDETFKDYCRRAHGLQISEHSINIVDLGDGRREIMVSDLSTDATAIISEGGEMFGLEFTSSRRTIE